MRWEGHAQLHLWESRAEIVGESGGNIVVNLKENECGFIKIDMEACAWEPQTGEELSQGQRPMRERHAGGLVCREYTTVSNMLDLA